MTTINSTADIRVWLDNAGLLEHLTADETDRVVELLAGSDARPAYGEDWTGYLDSRAQAAVCEVAAGSGEGEGEGKRGAAKTFAINGITYTAHELGEGRWSVRVEDPETCEAINHGPMNLADDEEISEALGVRVRFRDAGDHPTAIETIYQTA